MKTIIVFCLSIAVALCAPLDAPETESRRFLPALHHEHIHDELGYSVHYITAEGTVVSERGRLVPTHDGSDMVLIYEGEYSYIGPDGKTYVTKYTTDIAGAHQASGDHLPKAPEPEPEPSA